VKPKNSEAKTQIKRIRKWLTFIGVSTSNPLAFLVVGACVIIWLFFAPGSFNWQSAATVATWIMTLFIQRAEHGTRNRRAAEGQLREEARNELTMVDQHEPEGIEAHRQKAQNRANATP